MAQPPTIRRAWLTINRCADPGKIALSVSYMPLPMSSACMVQLLTRGNLPEGHSTVNMEVVADPTLAKGAKGDTGAVGPAGPPGPAGPAGPKGDKGDKGDRGDTGPAGATGAQGIQGPAGPAGPVGADGPRGLKGDTGSQGPAGPQGLKGDTGATGPQGPVGQTGAAGVTGAAGPKGDTGGAGPQGPKGDKGDTGATGPAGLSTVTPTTPARAIGTSFQPSATKATLVSYSAKTEVTTSLLGVSTATVRLLSDASNPPTTERARAEASSNAGVSVSLALTTSNTAPLTYIVPPGHYVRLVSAVTGTGATSIVSQTEETFG